MKMRKRKVVVSLGLIVLLLVGVFAFLWYPLMFETRLAAPARARRKIVRFEPRLESWLRAVLLLPGLEEDGRLRRQITVEVKKNMEKVVADSTEKPVKNQEREIVEAAESLLLYLRPDRGEVALPVDPEQSPIETANDPKSLRVNLNSEKRHQRNLLLWSYLNKYSQEDHLELIRKVYRSEWQRLVKRNFNPFRYLELWLRQRRTLSRMKSAYCRTKDHLEDARAVVLVTLNPQGENYDSRVAYLDLESQGFSSLRLERVRIEYQASPSAQVRLLRDGDLGGTLTGEDEPVGQFGPRPLQIDSSPAAGTEIELELAGLAELVQAAVVEPGEHGVDPYYGPPLFPIDARTRLMLVSEAPFEPKKMTFRLTNAVTGKRVDPAAVRFIDEETYRWRLDVTLTPEDFVAKHPQFSLQSSQLISDQEKPTVLLSPGRHTFSQVVVVPETVQLRLLAGTTLRFMPGVSLVSYAPVVAEGTPYSPIRFTSVTDEPWGTLAIVNTGQQRSSVSHIVVEEAGPARVNGVIYSGGLAAHDADITIKDSIFRSNHGDDGVNVKYGTVLIEGNRFIDNDFDGLDLDVVDGTVRDNEFSGNGNDGLDVSFNEAVIEDNLIRNNGDKCISIGEKSKAPVKGNVIESCAMGVAVKDQSEVVIEENQIRENKQGVAVYQKKPIFGGAVVRLKDNRFEGNQEDSWTDEKSTIVN